MGESTHFLYGYKRNMALRGLKITWVCIAILFISCSIILSFKFKNSTFLLFPKHFLLFLRSGKPMIFEKIRPKKFMEQAIVDETNCIKYYALYFDSVIFLEHFTYTAVFIYCSFCKSMFTPPLQWLMQ